MENINHIVKVGGSVLALCLLLACGLHKRDYVYPVNIPVGQEKEFDHFIRRGYRLYGKHCASCHGKYYTSKDGGDRFTELQIRNYAVMMKIRNETHEFTQRIPKDDIDAICVYLKYRK